MKYELLDYPSYRSFQFDEPVCRLTRQRARYIPDEDRTSGKASRTGHLSGSNEHPLPACRQVKGCIATYVMAPTPSPR